MRKNIKYIVPFIVIVFFGCISKKAIKNILVGDEPMPPPYVPIEYIIDKNKFSDIFSPDVINTYEAEIIILTMMATPNNYSEYLIKILGRNYNTGRILLELKSGKIIGGFVPDSYKEFDSAVNMSKKTRKEVVFWDSNSKAIIIKPYRGGKLGCVNVVKKKIINEEVFYDEWDTCKEEPPISYYWDHDK